MIQKQKHSIFIKCVSLLLIAVVMMPIATKIVHVFEHHEHKVCCDTITAHLHELDVDCEFYKFKLNPNFYNTTTIEDIFIEYLIFNVESTCYTLLRSHTQDTSFLRGPPLIV